MKPIIEDQYTAGRAYFLCVVGMLFFESLIQLPLYLLTFRRRARPFIKPSPTHSKIYSAIHRFLTLPSPLPWITKHPIANILRLAIFVGLNVLWGWNRFSYTGDYRLYGWLTIANGGLALLMAARTNLFAIVARIPSSTLLLYHRWIGRATVIHATLHFALNTHHYIETGQLMPSYANRRIQIGIMAWLSLCLIALGSIGFVRRRCFEIFYYTHALFIVFVVGAMIHAVHGPEFILPGLLLWAADRVFRFTRNFRPIRVIAATQYPGNLTKFRIEGLRTTHPGQIAWIQIPGVSFVNWHPFTIVSAPGDNEAVLAVRGLGGYTKTLQSVAANAKSGHQDACSEDGSILDKSMLKMRVDGPYGVGDIEWGIYPVTVLVAGGIGITPGISIAMHIIKNAKRCLEASACDANTNQWHIHLLWMIKDPAHAQWFEEELYELATAAADIRLPVTFDVTIHVTGGVAVQEGSMGMTERYEYRGPGVVVHGRPNLFQWFNEVKAARPGQDAAVNACGPRSMINNVRQAAGKASAKGSVFYVSEEVFEL